MKKLIISVLILTTTFAISAQADSPYAFGGACGSQGVWTAAALQATQNIRKVTLALRDDPNCKALGTSMQSSLEALNKLLAESQDEANGLPAEQQRMSQIPNEIAALRTFMTGNSGMKSKATGMLMSRAIEGAALWAKAEGASGTLIRDLGMKANRSAKTGLGLFNEIVDTLPQLNQCLTQDGSQFVGNMVSGLVQVATSFASSGADTTGSLMAKTINKITTYIRETKFSSVLRTLNTAEFRASMACLVEITSESYCNARDGASLFESGIADLKNKRMLNNKIAEGNPFVGYYVLNTHIPNITRWMQKIQIGVDPMLPTDAVFQNRIQQEVTDFYMGLKTLLGDYNSALLTIRNAKSLEAKQNQVLKLIQNISESMLRGGSTNAYNNGEKTNFFTMSKTPIKIPFFLIGMDHVPDQVLGRAAGLMKISYDDWLQANMSSMKEFQDPETLAETIGVNMRALAQEANASVIDYFGKWYIVDQPKLANEALTDVNYTVKDSFKAVRQYLDLAKRHIEKYNGEMGKVAMIMETQRKIDLVLEKFDKFDKVGRSFSAKLEASALTDEDIDGSQTVASDLIKTVYEQFVVMLARSGLLANRLVDIVNYDYALLINNKVDFSKYQQDIFTATGMAGLDRMLQMFNGNPANIKSDLMMGLDVNKANLAALETLLKDNFIKAISETKLVADDRNDSYTATARDSVGRLILDVTRAQNKVLFGIEMDNFFTRLAAIPAIVPKAIGYWWANPDRYPIKPDRFSPESEFGDAKALYTQFCVQILAFYNQNGIFDLCGSAVLQSPFKEKALDMSYDKRLRMHYDNQKLTAAEKRKWNFSDRICAFRDYNRNNMVYWMSLSKGDKETFIEEQRELQSPK